MILLDTHVVVWLAFAPEELSAKARAAIDRARADREALAISDITLLELTVLVKKGRIHLGISLESFLREVEARFVVLPITSRACVRSLQLPPVYPNDPADRIIGAAAQTEGLALITADQKIRRAKAIHTIW